MAALAWCARPGVESVVGDLPTVPNLVGGVIVWWVLALACLIPGFILIPRPRS
ncbi:hypothetical protein BH23ACT6_BH23ACT6_23460 [soil metagenome]